MAATSTAAPITAPNPVWAIRIAKDGKLEMVKIDTVNVEIRESVRPDNPADHEDYDKQQRRAARFHMIYHHNEAVLQPNIKNLPDVRKDFWNDEEWAKRGVYAMKKHPAHLFYTIAKEGQIPNSHFPDLLCGDAFILKYSDGKDKTGRVVYVDIEEEDHYALVIKDWIDYFKEKAKKWPGEPIFG